MKTQTKRLPSAAQVLPAINDLDAFPGLRIRVVEGDYDACGNLSEWSPSCELENERIDSIESLPDSVEDTINWLAYAMANSYYPPYGGGTRLVGAVILEDDNGPLSIDRIDLRRHEEVVTTEVQYWLEQRYEDWRDIIIEINGEEVHGSLYGEEECYDGLMHTYYMYFIAFDGRIYRLHYSANVRRWTDIDFEHPSSIEDVTGFIRVDYVENSAIWDYKN